MKPVTVILAYEGRTQHAITFDGQPLELPATVDPSTVLVTAPNDPKPLAFTVTGARLRGDLPATDAPVKVKGRDGTVTEGLFSGMSGEYAHVWSQDRATQTSIRSPVSITSPALTPTLLVQSPVKGMVATFLSRSVTWSPSLSVTLLRGDKGTHAKDAVAVSLQALVTNLDMDSPINLTLCTGGAHQSGGWSKERARRSIGYESKTESYDEEEVDADGEGMVDLVRYVGDIRLPIHRGGSTMIPIHPRAVVPCARVFVSNIGTDGTCSSEMEFAAPFAFPRTQAIVYMERQANGFDLHLQTTTLAAAAKNALTRVWLTASSKVHCEYMLVTRTKAKKKKSVAKPRVVSDDDDEEDMDEGKRKEYIVLDCTVVVLVTNNLNHNCTVVFQEFVGTDPVVCDDTSVTMRRVQKYVWFQYVAKPGTKKVTFAFRRTTPSIK